MSEMMGKNHNFTLNVFVYLDLRSFTSKVLMSGIFLGGILGRISAPSQFQNEQKLPKMVYIIPNFLVLQFGGKFMKI